MSSKNISHYLQNYGFVIPGNEIYGGRTGFYDYGHLGVLLKKNIQHAWEKYFVFKKTNSYFLDASIFTTENVWRSSGHLENFNDVLADCKQCKKRFRVDHLPVKEGNKYCPSCGSHEFTDPKPFNLIFKTQEDNYLRPETAQSIFINFKNILKVTNAKPPFCVCQVGKAFRNEVTLSSGIFRTKEFEQMECEWFVPPLEAQGCFSKCVKEMNEFLLQEIGIREENIRNVDIAEEDRAHYSSQSLDIEFKFPHGWGELWGLANRTDFDLMAHSKGSNTDLVYFDAVNKEKYTPFVVEHSIGLNRLLYAVVSDAYCIEKLEGGEEREVLKIKHDLAPYKFSVLPLTKNEKQLAHAIFLKIIERGISVSFLDKGSIGKRYRKNDSIGTPYCITVDQESFLNPEDPTFTIRDRDSMKQRRVNFSDLEKHGFKINF